MSRKCGRADRSDQQKKNTEIQTERLFHRPGPGQTPGQEKPRVGTTRACRLAPRLAQRSRPPRYEEEKWTRGSNNSAATAGSRIDPYDFGFDPENRGRATRRRRATRGRSRSAMTRRRRATRGRRRRATRGRSRRATRGPAAWQEEEAFLKAAPWWWRKPARVRK